MDAGDESKRSFADLAREHSGLALTTLYLLLIAIGMMYEWWLFRRFNINILLYAQAADFLLVPFREPLVVLIALAPIPLFMAYMAAAGWLTKKLMRKKEAKEVSEKKAAANRRLMRVINVWAMALWSFAFTAEYAEWVWERIRAGKRQTVTVEMAAANGVTPASIKGTIIGTTSQFVFVYEREMNRTRIIAAENIADIVVEGKKPKPTKAR